MPTPSKMNGKAVSGRKLLTIKTIHTVRGEISRVELSDGSHLVDALETSMMQGGAMNEETGETLDILKMIFVGDWPIVEQRVQPVRRPGIVGRDGKPIA